MKKIRSFELALFVLLPSITQLACTTAPLESRKIALAPFEPVAWIELGPDSTVSARLITGAAECPRLQLDGGKNELPMGLRAAPNDAFPVRVCEALIPSGTQSARLGDQDLPLPPANPHRILFIGDTGCRIQVRDGKPEAQWCNDPKGWPFPTLAKYEAAVEPDLIVHLGDYLYREAPCPPGNAYCAGSPSGDNWASWNADFFEAARPLLRKAPWIFVRGNHELCKRAGTGWFRFLNVGDTVGACADETDPFLVKQGGVQVVVLDSALATDLKAPDDQVQIYRRQFQKIAAMRLRHAWLVTHKPLWAPGLGVSYNQTLQTASQNRLPKGIDTVFSGHLHLFEELHFADGRPSQIVAGNGGTTLTVSKLNDPTGIELAGTTVSAGSILDDFGYFTLESGKGSTWEGTAYDGEGRAHLLCDGLGSKAGMHCRPAGTPGSSKD